MDVGQTVVISDRACVAVEAMEGTDETIVRAARIAGGKPLVVVKGQQAGAGHALRCYLWSVAHHRTDEDPRVRTALAVDAGRTRCSLTGEKTDRPWRMQRESRSKQFLQRQ